MVRKFLVKVNGKEYVVEVEELGTGAESAVRQERRMEDATRSQVTTSIAESRAETQAGAATKSEQPVRPAQTERIASVTEQGHAGHTIIAPMSGVILKVLVSAGQRVEHGQKVVILEAMKMENDIVADRPGVVKSVKVKEGDNVDTGQVLVELE